MCADGPASDDAVSDAREPVLLSHDDLTRFLAGQRWFAGKSRTWQISATNRVGWLRREEPAVDILLVTVAYDDGDTETYQLPLVHHPGPVETLMHVLVGQEERPDGETRMVFDALHDKDATTLWWQGIVQSTEPDGLAFHRDPSATLLPEVGRSLVVGAEQSNTSLIFGDTAIMKVFRKVSPGLNPDIEMHAALAAAHSTHIATPYGWLEGRWPVSASGPTATASLAMAQAFLRDATEGWELAKTSVRDLYAEADLHADEVGGDFAGESARLGAATAGVHAALAVALPTGSLEGKELAAVADGMRERLDRAAVEVSALEPFVAGLRTAFEDLSDLDRPVHVQRVHGDLHLGQVLRALDGWKILDFEGEPARPLDERRSLESPMKDVAGMLRSFDYAARHLLVDYPADPQREYRASEWADRNREAFCDGYAAASGRDPRDHAVLLRAFETDKAVYEVVYEARNRPTWVPVPMSAIRRLAGPASAADAQADADGDEEGTS